MGSTNELTKETLDEKIGLVRVKELLNESFYIPDFQRGYRWTPSEVEDMLRDFEEFFETNSPDTKSFYCLQPLVVCKKDGEEHWTVIDGQQRLTTLFLILNFPSHKCNMSIEYQTRDGSKEYLNKPVEKKRDEYIDYYHIYNAYQKILEFFKNRNRADFVNKIIEYPIKFIWHNLTDEINNTTSAEEKFSELNIGKIPLTNAELIKALLINASVAKNERSDETEESKLFQRRMAMEWDLFEQGFGDDDFWSFVYGKDNGRYATRIEYLFDILMKKDEKNENEHFTFEKISQEIKEAENKRGKAIEIWGEISALYNKIRGWYDDRELYHIIGYLRYADKELIEILKIFDDETTEDYGDFYRKLKLEAITDLLGVKKGNPVSEDDISRFVSRLSYGGGKNSRDKIRRTLLLFNILTVLEITTSIIRFSFNNFYKNAGYDIEHISSQTESDFTGKERESWIKSNLFYFTGLDYTNKKASIAEIKSEVVNCDAYKDEKIVERSMEQENIKTKDVCDKLLHLLENNQDPVYKSDAYNLIGKIFQLMEPNDKHRLGNLVLLGQKTNRAYGNTFFPIKRRWISKDEKEGEYILPCTKNVFSKSYSKIWKDLMNWTETDAENYEEEIIRVLNHTVQ